MWEQYFIPETLDAALALLAHHGAAARAIAGGTDLLLDIRHGRRTPVVLIDVTRIPGLDQIREADGLLHVGPLVTHNKAIASPLLVEKAFPLAAACWEIGAPQIRNRGTIGGNIVTATPASDTIPPLWALGATFRLQSAAGERVLTCPQFFQGLRQTPLCPDELLTDITFRPLTADERGTFIKLGPRKSQAIAMASVAVVLTFAGTTIHTARIALGSVAPTVVPATAAEAFLTGKTLDSAVIEEAGRLAATAACPRDSFRSPADYRMEMAHTLTVRALRQLRDGTERDPWPAHPVLLWGLSRAETKRTFTPGDGTRHAQPAISLTVNGQPYTFHNVQDRTLLWVLREELGLTGTKEGCSEGECGACTVYLDGAAVLACLVPAAAAAGRSVMTIEGLTQEAGGSTNQVAAQGATADVTQAALHPVQQAFIEASAVQCGYCTPGFIMAGAKLLEEHPNPTRKQIEQAISGNLCRCTGYVNIVKAIERAAQHIP